MSLTRPITQQTNGPLNLELGHINDGICSVDTAIITSANEIAQGTRLSIQSPKLYFAHSFFVAHQAIRGEDATGSRYPIPGRVPIVVTNINIACATNKLSWYGGPLL
ncbi:hypothetical protein N7447_003718 [Penicillium robsamsonii]|uniref:uncharacterized protein n=1 Tax=Penicillium robsamsonii TaxID=1792511 RepID=UPI0025495B01|nr:uncharacterized protein N7447_003718 [Penicillium robsamsonii]KAJ5826955.1 hypothetical protein N7447_003718 [Penicillium robsamsonii]